MSNKSKVVLIILDGFGASAVEEGNAVLKANTPFLDYCWGNFSKTLLRASGEEVGLTWGEMGNSEVGHLNIGTGRISMQDLPRINKGIEDGSFFKMPYLLDACEHAKKHNSTLHLVGLLSNGGVHSSIEHLLALLDLAHEQKVNKVSLHLFTDGRDMAKQSAEKLIKELKDKIVKLNLGTITSMIGRFYAMDRDNNWDRIQKAYDLMTVGKGEKYNDASEALSSKYKAGEDDEKLSPILLDEKLLVSDNDAMICFNFRADRTRQIAETFISPNFNKFKRGKWAKNLRFISFVSYGNEQTPLVDVAYVAENIEGQLAEIIAKSSLSQCHIAETEKYAHVTYFFNGGIEKPYMQEKRIIVPSPKIPSYDMKPEMSAQEVTSEFIKHFKQNKPDFSVINFANPDMVGHTGNMAATVKAIEFVDKCCKQIVQETFDGETSYIITADHGNADQMINLETKEIDKQHTTNPVPMVIIKADNTIDDTLSNKISYEEKIAFFAMEPAGVLADIAPTVLDLIGLTQSEQMTGIDIKDSI